jgi:hypothetical protein
MSYHKIISSTTGSDGTPLRVHATDHVDEVDMRVLLALSNVSECPLRSIVLVLKKDDETLMKKIIF